MKKKAFSLIELMVVISILSIGIVMIARSFLSASNALSNGEHRIMALNYLEGKMADIEEQTLKSDDKLMNTQDSTVIGSKAFKYTSSSDKMKFGEGEDKDVVDKVSLTASWSEGSAQYDEILATYVILAKKR